MPTEHEYKYLLHLDVIDELEDMWLPCSIIRQGYLATSDSMDLRIRQSTAPNGREHRVLTFKQKVGERKIEIEQDLDVRDATDLWKVAYSKLKKIRYYVDNYNGNPWEIDFFYRDEEDNDDLYFAMAEIELPEGSPAPKEIPEFLQKHILYEVPLTDDRFSNKHLGNAEYAMKLYTEIPGERHDDINREVTEKTESLLAD